MIVTYPPIILLLSHLFNIQEVLTMQILDLSIDGRRHYRCKNITFEDIRYCGWWYILLHSHNRFINKRANYGTFKSWNSYINTWSKYLCHTTGKTEIPVTLHIELWFKKKKIIAWKPEVRSNVYMRTCVQISLVLAVVPSRK